MAQESRQVPQRQTRYVPGSEHASRIVAAQRLTNALCHAPGEAITYEVERNRFASGIFTTTQSIASHNWTMGELKRLHMDLTKLMKAEHQTLEDTPDHPVTV